MSGAKTIAGSVPRAVKLDSSIERMEIDFSVPRVIRIVALNSKLGDREYLLKITPRGGAVLV